MRKPVLISSFGALTLCAALTIPAWGLWTLIAGIWIASILVLLWIVPSEPVSDERPPSR